MRSWKPFAVSLVAHMLVGGLGLGRALRGAGDRNARTRSGIRAALGIAIASSLLACAQAPRQDSIALGPGETEHALEPWMLTQPMAEQLRLDPQSAVLQLARQRPARSQAITAVRFVLRDSRDGSAHPRLMRLARTAQGLQYFDNRTLDASDANSGEAGLWLFGVGTVVIRAWWSKDHPLSPDEVRLRSGTLFAPDQPFTLVEGRGPSAETVQVCAPSRRLPASNLHRKLQGQATVYSCTTRGPYLPDEGFKTLIVYLDEYAQYLPFANPQDEGGGWMQFEIADVRAGPA